MVALPWRKVSQAQLEQVVVLLEGRIEQLEERVATVQRRCNSLQGQLNRRLGLGQGDDDDDDDDGRAEAEGTYTERLLRAEEGKP